MSGSLLDAPDVGVIVAKAVGRKADRPRDIGGKNFVGLFSIKSNTFQSTLALIRVLEFADDGIGRLHLLLIHLQMFELFPELLDGSRIITADAIGHPFRAALVILRSVHQPKTLTEGLVNALPASTIPVFTVMSHEDRLSEGNGSRHLVGLIQPRLRPQAHLFCQGTIPILPGLPLRLIGSDLFRVGCLGYWIRHLGGLGFLRLLLRQIQGNLRYLHGLHQVATRLQALDRLAELPKAPILDPRCFIGLRVFRNRSTTAPFLWSPIWV